MLYRNMLVVTNIHKKILLLISCILFGYSITSYWVHQQINSKFANELALNLHDNFDIEMTQFQHTTVWRYLYSWIEINNLKTKSLQTTDIIDSSVKQIRIRVNLLKSILYLEPVVDYVVIDSPVIYKMQSLDAAARPDYKSLLKHLSSFTHMQRVAIYNASVFNYKANSSETLLSGLNINIVQHPELVSNNIKNIDFAINIDFSTEEYFASSSNDIAMTVDLFARLSCLNNELQSTKLRIWLKDIHARIFDKSISLDEYSAELSLDQFFSDQKINLTNIYFLKNKAKHYLPDISCVISEYSYNTNLKFVLHEVNVARIMEKLNLQSNAISYDELIFDVGKLTFNNTELQLSFRTGHLLDWDFNTQLCNLSIINKDLDVAVDIISAKLHSNANNTLLQLKNTSVKLPTKYVNNNDMNNTVLGDIKVKHNKDGFNISTDNLRLNLLATNINVIGELNKPEAKKTRFKFSGSFSQDNIHNILFNVTDNLLQKKLLHWLRGALPNPHDVNGDFMVQQDLNKADDVQFKEIFKINAYVKNALFVFDEHWEPIKHTDVRFNFDNGVYNISLLGGYLGAVELDNANTTFTGRDDLDFIIVNTQTKGKIADLISYLHHSEVKSHTPSQQDYFYDGFITANIAMQIPLEDKFDFIINAKANIESGVIKNIQSQQVLLKDFVGSLTIDNGKLSSKSILNHKKGFFNLKIDGMSKMSLLQQEDSLSYNLQSTILYQDDIVPTWKVKVSGDNPRINITSVGQNDLINMSQFVLDGEYKQNSFNSKLLGGNGFLAKIEYNNQTLQLQVDRGNLSHYTLYSFVNSCLPKSDNDKKTIDNINVTANNFNISNLNFKKLQLKCHINDNNIVVKSLLKDNLGEITYIPKYNAWAGSFDKLTFGWINSNSVEFTGFTPELNIILKIHAKELWVNKNNFGTINLVYNPNKNNAISTLPITTVFDDNKQEEMYNLQFKLSTKYMNDFIKELGLSSKIYASTGDVLAELKWPNKKYINLSDLDGLIRVSLKRGSLNIGDNINSGKKYFGKVIAILNTAAIPNRLLSMNFDDLTSEDFVFDSLSGDIRLLEGSKYTTNNLNIATTSALFGLVGNINTISNTIDCRLAVIPKLTSSAPLFALVLGGPVAGLATLAANSLIGDKIDKLSMKEFVLQGPLQKPIITEMN